MDKKHASLSGGGDASAMKQPELQNMLSGIHRLMGVSGQLIRQIEHAGHRLGDGPLNEDTDEPTKEEAEPQSIQAHLEMIHRRLSGMNNDLSTISRHFDGLI